MLTSSPPSESKSKTNRRQDTTPDESDSQAYNDTTPDKHIPLDRSDYKPSNNNNNNSSYKDSDNPFLSDLENSTLGLNATYLDDDEFTGTGNLDGENEEEEENEVNLMFQVWVNERRTPELLKYREELVNELMQLMEFQNENLNESNIFRIMDCKAEIERIRFVLSSYLRTRIHKIEKFAKYIERTSSEMEKLSPAEKTWVKEYNKGLDRHFKDSALKYLPPNMQKLDEVDGYAELDMVTKPDLDGTVCIQVLEDIGEYSLSNREDQEDTIRMEKGQIYFLRYSSIRQLLDEGRVRMT